MCGKTFYFLHSLWTYCAENNLFQNFNFWFVRSFLNICPRWDSIPVGHRSAIQSPPPVGRNQSNPILWRAFEWLDPWRLLEHFLQSSNSLKIKRSQNESLNAFSRDFEADFIRSVKQQIWQNNRRRHRRRRLDDHDDETIITSATATADNVTANRLMDGPAADH